MNNYPQRVRDDNELWQAIQTYDEETIIQRITDLITEAQIEELERHIKWATRNGKVVDNLLKVSVELGLAELKPKGDIT